MHNRQRRAFGENQKSEKAAAVKRRKPEGKSERCVSIRKRAEKKQKDHTYQQKFILKAERLKTRKRRVSDLNRTMKNADNE